MSNENEKADVATQLKQIQSLTSQLAEAEAEYQEAKEEVSELWKEYWPASERKKTANARRKDLAKQVEDALEAAPELKALVKSIA